MTARLVVPPGGVPHNSGEQRAVELLVRELPSTDYAVIPNILIPDGAGRLLEYDAIVVAPHAVYALEIKDWWAPIQGDEREWLVGGRSRPSPIGSIEHKAKVLKSYLIDAKPVLARAWVEAAVVVSSEPSAFVLTPGARRRAFLLPEIVAFLSDPAGIGKPADGIRTLDTTIEAVILGRAQPARGPRRFNGYEVRETLEESDAETWFLAYRPELPGAPDVMLRVVSLSAYLHSPSDRERERKALNRELEAVARAGFHPNVVPVRDVFEDESALVAVLDVIKGISLRQRLEIDPSLTLDQRTKIVLGVARGLAHLHSHEVIHRAVEPGNVLLDERLEPRLTRFAFAKIQVEGVPTVWPTEEGQLESRPYRSPELRKDPHAVGSATDLYSLGCLAYSLFAGAMPFENTPTAAGPPPLPDTTPGELAALIPRLLDLDPGARPTATDVVAALAPQAEPAIIEPSGSKVEYEPQDVIDDKFEVRSVLGRGGFSCVYRVYYALDDRDYALKVFNRGNSYEKLRRELSFLREISHPNIVRVVWADKTSSGQWYLVSEYVEGEPLDNYAYGPKWLTPNESITVIRDLLGALAAIHPNEARLEALDEIRKRRDLTPEEYEEYQQHKSGIVHRDVKPQNLILTSHGVVLIDFNIASYAGDRVDTQSGTPPYRPPDADLTRWDVSTDLFATGVVLYELLCHEHPFATRPGTELEVTDPRTYRPDLAQPLVDFLLRACAPERSARFATAQEMRLALDAVGEPLVSKSPPVPAPADEPATPNTNPFVTRFLEMGSQARRSNGGTRGLNELARTTYVETRLDEDLAASVLGGRHRLVVVTGNAGDGKTAFIQQLESRALAQGAQRQVSTTNGGELQFQGRTLLTLYDGSQDEEMRSSDDVLNAFFGRVLGSSDPGGITGIIAVNEGRLRDFVAGHGLSRPDLFSLLVQLDDPTSAPTDPTIALVNLNLRSVTSGGADSILTRQIAAIVSGPFWSACEPCDWRVQCPIKHNVDSLADPTSGPLAVERLRKLVDVVRLRGRRHLTLRDLRSIVAFILFRDRTCEEIGELVGHQGGPPLDLLDLTYPQAIGGRGLASGSELDRGVRLLQEIDVAQVSNPDLDRLLAGGHEPRRAAFDQRESELSGDLIADLRATLPAGTVTDPGKHRLVHDAHRRYMYFERADDGWGEMLPYRRLGQFEEAISDAAVRDALKLEILAAISASEGISDGDTTVAELRLTTGDESAIGFRSFRRFPSHEFELLVATVDAPYVEAEPDHLELVHIPSQTRLPVDLDLLEVLGRMNQGHVASVDERRGFMLNLTLFKNRLLMEPARELIFRHDGDQMALSVAKAGAVMLEPTLQ